MCEQVKADGRVKLSTSGFSSSCIPTHDLEQLLSQAQLREASLASQIAARLEQMEREQREQNGRVAADIKQEMQHARSELALLQASIAEIAASAHSDAVAAHQHAVWAHRDVEQAKQLRKEASGGGGGRRS